MSKDNAAEREAKRKVIGERLRALRTATGRSRRELAEFLGTYYGRVCNWENGRASPSDSYMETLADLYGVSVEFLSNDEAA